MTQNVEKVGTEFLVNTQTYSGQYQPTITGLTNGGFVVSWYDTSGTLGDASGSSIKAQIFDAAGGKAGTEFLVNTQTVDSQYEPTITSLTNGGFVVSWYDYSRTLGDTESPSVKAQVFNAAGGKVGTEILVNTQTASGQAVPTIAGLTNGGFVVSWYDYSGTLGDTDLISIKAQVFGAAGGKVGTEFLVNTQTASYQYQPTITGLTNGGFVVSWQDYSGTLGDADGFSIKAQVFDPAGGKVGTEFLVNTQTANGQYEPTITGLTNGGFVVSWYDYGGTLGDASGSSIKAQVFDAAGGKVGTEFLVNTQTANSQDGPTITGLTNGGFVVSWYDYSGTLGDASESSIKAQVFSATGSKVGMEFLVNTQTAGGQYLPTITGLTNGGFVVSWNDSSGTLGDASGSSIKAQVYALVSPNSAPVVVGESVTLSGSAASADAAHGVLVNDSDVDGNPLVVSAVQGSSVGVGHAVAGTYGALTLNADGSYSYAMTSRPAGAGAHDVFAYTVADGAGGTAAATIDFALPTPGPLLWKAGVTGDWSNAANWVDGFVPSATDDVLIPEGGSHVRLTGVVQTRDIVVAADDVNPSTFTIDGGTLTARSLKMSGAEAEYGYTVSTLNVLGTATLNVSDVLLVGLDSQLFLGADPNAGSAAAHLVINGAVIADGYVGTERGSILINGDVSGLGRLAVGQGGVLEVNGAATIDSIGLGQQAKLVLDDAADSTARIFTSGHASDITLDFKNAASFGGSLWVQGRQAGIDLAGAASATLSGSTLHVVMQDGHTLDLKTYLFPDFINGPVDLSNYTIPNHGTVATTSDGHGGLDISFLAGQQQVWKGGDGEWTDPAKWVSGTVPGAFDDVVVRGSGSVVHVRGTQSAASITEDFGASGSGAVIVHGNLTVSDTISLTSNPAGSGVAFLGFDNGAVLTVGGGISLDAGSELYAYQDPGVSATINGSISGAGLISLYLDQHITINGSVTGAEIVIYGTSTLDLNGASDASIYVTDPGTTLRLGNAAAATGMISLGQNVRLDLEGASSFGGTLKFSVSASSVDLIGIDAASVKATPGHLLVTQEDGSTLDLAVTLPAHCALRDDVRG